MQLTSVDIRNYRAIESISLKFLDPLRKPRPLTVISGPNGSGKTSILFAIAQALRGVMGYRTTDVPVPTRDDIRSSASASGEWIADRPEVRVDVGLFLPEEERRAILGLLKALNMEAPRDLPDGELTVHWRYPPGLKHGTRLNWWAASVEPATPYVRSWLNARRLAIRAWARREPVITYDLLAQIGGLMFFPQDRNLKTRIIGEATTAPRIISNGGMETDDEQESEDESPVDATRQRERPELTITEILHYLSDYAKNRVPPLPDDQNWEKRIQTAFERVCAPKKYIGYLYRGDSDQVGSPILERLGRKYPLSHAASGEQVILEYITRLTYPSPSNRSLILIDEPEIHLHPAWIRKLYVTLQEIGFRNQYIVTTHSSELRQRAAADNCLIDLGSLDESA